MDLEEVMRELLMELMKCSIEELHEVKIEWGRRLAESKIRLELKAHCLALVELVIQQKEGAL